MKTKSAIAKRIILELKSDKRTIALLIVAPIFLITIIAFLFNATYQNFTIGLVDQANYDLNINNSTTVDYDSSSNLEDDVYDQKVDIGLVISQDLISINDIIDYNLDENQAKVLNKYQIKYPDLEVPNIQILKTGENPLYDQYMVSEIISSIETDTNIIDQENIKYSYGTIDFTIMLVMEFLIMFLSFLTVGIAFLRERENYTLERTLSNNIKRNDIIWGYMLGYGSIAIVQSIIIEIYTITVLQIEVFANIPLSILVNILFALFAISLGMFISAYAKSEFQVMQFIPIVIVSQLIFSGVLPYGNIYQILSKLSPLTYATDAQVKLLLQDSKAVGVDILVIILLILLLNIITSRRLKKTREV